MYNYRGFSIDIVSGKEIGQFIAEGYHDSGIIRIGKGNTKEEALDDIKDFISEFLDITDLD